MIRQQAMWRYVPKEPKNTYRSPSTIAGDCGDHLGVNRQGSWRLLQRAVRLSFFVVPERDGAKPALPTTTPTPPFLLPARPSYSNHDLLPSYSYYLRRAGPNILFSLLHTIHGLRWQSLASALLTIIPDLEYSKYSVCHSFYPNPHFLERK